MSDTDQTFVPLPKLPADGLRITPLGGLGEIGRNMTVLEHQSRLMVMDCGVLFPEEHQPGVDLILPDFATLRERLDKIEAIVLTHEIGRASCRERVDSCEGGVPLHHTGSESRTE